MSCWFCSVRDEEAEHLLAVEMYGEVNALEVKSQTKVAYKVQHIKIPRCADCHSRHIIANLVDILAIILVVIFLVSILFAVFGWVAQLIWALIMGVSFGLLVGTLAVRFLALKGIRSIRDAKMNYPEIKELLEKCYRFGMHPKGQVTESDPICNSVVENSETSK